MTAADSWRAALEGWAIPEHILEQAPESPWWFPPEAFAARARPSNTRSHERALEALPDRGRVIDVGAGGGAMSSPLRVKAARVVAVDSQDSMLEQVAADKKVLGRWPDVASDAGKADVVVCGHVLYNVADLAPFVGALDRAARGRVVVEVTAEHPLVREAWLWKRFWGIDRPTGPGFGEAVAVIREMGIEPVVEEWESAPATFSFERLERLVAFHRRRLCLPASRDPEIAEAIADRAVERDGRWFPSGEARHSVTIWWDR